MENNSALEKILLVFNRNAELLRLVGATFYGFSQKDDEEKFDHSEKPFFVLFVLSLVTFELSNIN